MSASSTRLGLPLRLLKVGVVLCSSLSLVEIMVIDDGVATPALCYAIKTQTAKGKKCLGGGVLGALSCVFMA